MKEKIIFLLLSTMGVATLINPAIPQAVALYAKPITVVNKPAINSFNQQLINGEWLLEDLGGIGVVERVQTTFHFDGKRITGSGGCNRYNAGALLNGDRLKISAIASTRKMCPLAVMNQENRYFQALQKATRVTLKDSYLLIYSQGMNTPLRFTKLTTK